MAAKNNTDRETKRIGIERGGGDPYLNLAVAIIVQAIRDVRQAGRPLKAAGARDWLRSEGMEWLQAFDICISQAEMDSWLAAGCPDLVRDSSKESGRGLFDRDEDNDSLMFGGYDDQ